jgi:tRNA/tmRNA/rRNA uracil-C5-methylase (TrmA/RlmC/RlmD family)
VTDLLVDQLVGDQIDLTVGRVAHGGHCVARHEGQVVFVRHALPGERVRAVVTEQRRAFLRADAVAVLSPSPDRVVPPCPYAGPDRCGGCDFQHATPAAQRLLKAAVVREQLVRLAGVTVDVVVEPLPGDVLGWRSRVQYTVDGAGRVGFHKHRSNEVVPVDRCLIADTRVQDLPVTSQPWLADVGVVEVVASSGGDLTVATRRSRQDSRFRVVSGPPVVRELSAGREWRVPADGFWQVHRSAADVLAMAVVELLRPRQGERVWDLYGGVGLFAAALAPLAGPVTVVESDARAVAAARRNLADLPRVRVVHADVAAALGNARWRAVDVVVLDPPRAGAGAAVVRAILERHPRAVAYVACDPASLARDVATFAAAGWRLAALRAFDAFPMTHHVECVALLTPGPSD